MVSGSTLTYSWIPPETLDIDDQEDIEGYCVEVVNSISLVTLHSECNITATNYSYTIPLMSWCFVPLFTVIPINVVGRGTPSTKSYIGAEGRKFCAIDGNLFVLPPCNSFSNKDTNIEEMGGRGVWDMQEGRKIGLIHFVQGIQRLVIYWGSLIWKSLL